MLSYVHAALLPYRLGFEESPGLKEMFKENEHGNQINPLGNGLSNDFKILKGEAELDRLRVGTSSRSSITDGTTGTSRGCWMRETTRE